jgi:hypothetical protein
MSFPIKVLPLVDEHKMHHQEVLGLERKWPTQCCCTHLVVTLTCMSVVDMHRRYRIEKRKWNRVMCGQALEGGAAMIRFSDLFCGQLIKRDCPTERPTIHQQITGDEGILERINISGELTCPLTREKAKLGNTVGHTIQQNCFVCRRYLNDNGNTTYALTTSWYNHCHMPWCNLDHHHEATGHEQTCE